MNANLPLNINHFGAVSILQSININGSMIWTAKSCVVDIDKDKVYIDISTIVDWKLPCH
jgi:hypothetical protein